MAKRRSSTRLPRRPKPPRDAEHRPIPAPPTTVIHGPVLAHDVALRAVRATDAMNYVEEWNGRLWVPSAHPMHLVLRMPLATREELRARDVPDDPPMRVDDPPLRDGSGT